MGGAFRAANNDGFDILDLEVVPKDSQIKNEEADQTLSRHQR